MQVFAGKITLRNREKRSYPRIHFALSESYWTTVLYNAPTGDFYSQPAKIERQRGWFQTNAFSCNVPGDSENGTSHGFPHWQKIFCSGHLLPPFFFQWRIPCTRVFFSFLPIYFPLHNFTLVQGKIAGSEIRKLTSPSHPRTSRKQPMRERLQISV